MAQRRTHYEVLGIARTASATEIKTAYRKAARVTHPDHGGNAEDFGAVTLAYETLIDPASRQRYDRSYGTESSYLRGKAPSAGGYGPGGSAGGPSTCPPGLFCVCRFSTRRPRAGRVCPRAPPGRAPGALPRPGSLLDATPAAGGTLR